MMELDELQSDALGEIFNIGVGRAASALSQIVNSEIELSAPQVKLAPISEVRQTLAANEFNHFSSVSQHFEGPFNAEAVLIFPETNALIIVSQMLGSHLSPEELSEYEQEAMCEVGNIILNACISVLADLFHVEFNGGLPAHRFGDRDSLGFDLDEDSSYVLLLQISMKINQSNVEGHLLFLLGVKSLESLFACIDAYLVEQGLK
jgi:chemotaxis protein CheC